jgi:hypothetical protein
MSYCKIGIYYCDVVYTCDCIYVYVVLYYYCTVLVVFVYFIRLSVVVKCDLQITFDNFVNYFLYPLCLIYR